MMLCDPAFKQLSTHKSWSDCNDKAWDSTVPYTQSCLQEKKAKLCIRQRQLYLARGKPDMPFSTVFIFLFSTPHFLHF